MSSSNGKEPRYVTMLNAIDEAAKVQDGRLAEEWSKFKTALDETAPESKEEALWREFIKNKTDTEEFVRCWIHPGDGKQRPTQVAAIRLLGRTGQKGQEQAKDVFDKLWSLATDCPCNEVKTWALYSMHYCNRIVFREVWEEKFRQKMSPAQGECRWLQSMPDDEVRSWAVFAIADMAHESALEKARKLEKARGLNNNNAPRTYCRLDSTLLSDVETFVLNHWPQEYDIDVKANLVNALGWSAGWGGINIDSWRVPGVLRSAAESSYARAPSHVSWAIKQIATSIMQTDSMSTDTKLKAIEELLNLAYELTINCPIPEAREISDDQDVYEYKREYLQSIRNIARIALRDQLPQSAEVVTSCSKHLLAFANCKPDSTNNSAFGESLIRLRWLTLVYLNDLALDEKKLVPKEKQFLQKEVTPTYELMLGDRDQEIVQTVVANMVTLMGEEDAADYFAEVILNSESKQVKAAVAHYCDRYGSKNGQASKRKPEDPETYVRRVAARALGTIENNNEAHDRLVDALQREGMVGSWARDALLTMGGLKAMDAMVQHSLQRMVEDRYFRPMQDTREKGWKILKQVEAWSNSNYQYAYKAAIASFVVGVGLILVGVLYALNPDADQTTVQWIFGSATVTTLAGIVGTFLWEPVKGLQKVQSELTQVLMSFENYLGRMSLIGLGFAHAFTEKDFNQLRFLRGISELSGKAMRESAAGLVDIGAWPNYKHIFDEPYTAVPSLEGKRIEEALQLIEQAELRLEEGQRECHTDRADNSIISQQPAAGVYIAKGEAVQVIVSRMDPEKFAMPDFKYKTIPEALDLAREKKLTITKLEFFFNDNIDIDEGRVIKQDPPTTKKVVDGAEVTLTICKKNVPTGGTNGASKDSVPADANEAANGSKTNEPSRS